MNRVFITRMIASNEGAGGQQALRDRGKKKARAKALAKKEVREMVFASCEQATEVACSAHMVPQLLKTSMS